MLRRLVLLQPLVAWLKLRRASVLGLAFVALATAACERPDASHTTSPSARLMIGTTLGNVALRPPEELPDLVPPPAGWAIELGNARFEKLENGTHSLIVIGQYTTQPGPGVVVWLSDEQGVLARWSGGSARQYSGVVCWQHRLESDDGKESLALNSDGQYTLALGFRNLDDESIIASATVPVRNAPPRLTASEPGPGSEVFRDLLGCPRGS